jgi:hypothetical protein
MISLLDLGSALLIVTPLALLEAIWLPMVIHHLQLAAQLARRRRQ